MPLLAGDAVVLRPVAEPDVDPYAAAFRDDPALGRRAGFDVDPTEDWVRSRLEGAAERRATGRFAELAVVDPNTDDFLGAVALHHFEWPAGRVELAVWLAPAARGRGIAHGALSLVLDWLFEVGFRRAELRTTPDNEPMCTLAERLGFVREGVLRRYAVERGVEVDVVVFGLLRSEWPVTGG
jgi:RimJ/RimL family protein N-acetyltransferase